MASRHLTASFRAALRHRSRPHITQTRQASSFLQERPSPPRLPAEQQAEFERLQRAAEAQLNTHTQIEPPLSSPGSPIATSRHVTTADAAQTKTALIAEGGQPDTMVSLSGGIRKGAPPEFEGDKNPKTGEIGGPKNEPLRWGAQGDYSFNGRVTDF
ncbi:putative mitochondrial protein, conserved [Rhypophila decipiens]|uniref:Succinate dehydrogenase assembly factor 4, mitochondrial n=1 Tax=Rhypophila decipiens TaxID=261697 RepID=A0AAN6Y7S9_9PEZI|nr:putative mitochondrial protein, conserved [Rhypophila decipiens]